MPTLPERILTLVATLHIRREKVLEDFDALYAPDVRFVDPLHDVTGKDRFLRINENVLRRLDIRFDDLALVGGEPHFMISWTVTMKARVGGPEIVAPGVSELRSENGLVVYHRDHWDLLSATAAAIPGLRAIYPRITGMLFGG